MTKKFDFDSFPEPKSRQEVEEVFDEFTTYLEIEIQRSFAIQAQYEKVSKQRRRKVEKLNQEYKKYIKQRKKKLKKINQEDKNFMEQQSEKLKDIQEQDDILSLNENQKLQESQEQLLGDDGLWEDPWDRFAQVKHFSPEKQDLLSEDQCWSSDEEVCDDPSDEYTY